MIMIVIMIDIMHDPAGWRLRACRPVHAHDA
jgi:hypothetical protein